MTDAFPIPSRLSDRRRGRLTKFARLLCAALPLIGTPACAQRSASAEVSVIDHSPSVLPAVEPDRARLPTRLIWSDEFNGTALDPDKWPRNGVFRFPGQPADTTLAAVNGETERYDPSEVVFSGREGHVHLRCEPDIGAEHVAWGQSLLPRVGKAPYAGQGLPRLFGVTEKCGMIHTYPDYVSPPGSMIEMRVQLPTGCKGRWPAAWMFNYNYPADKAPNPNAAVPFAGQENDIFEGNGLGKLKITQHNGMKPEPQVTVVHPSGWFTVRQWRDQVDGRVYEWIDDKLVAVMPAGNINDLTLPVMLNIAGGTPNWAFIGLPDATTPRTCEILVDYVRIYR